MKKALLSSIAVIVLCVSIIAGSTFALFTDVEEVNIAVSSATVDIEAEATNLKTWSLYEIEANARTDGSFTNGGYAELTDESTVDIYLMTPGDVVKFTIDVTNNSNVDVQYQLRAISDYQGTDPAKDLAPALVIKAFVDHDADITTPAIEVTLDKNASSDESAWYSVEFESPEIKDIDVVIEFPNTDNSLTDENLDNVYQNCTANLTFTLVAVQGNYNTNP